MEYEIKVSSLNHEELVNILSCADTGCEYWCSEWNWDEKIYHSTKNKMIQSNEWKNKIICFEDVLTKMLLNGENIDFYDSEDNETYTLTYDKLKRGIELYICELHATTAIDEWDANDADNAIQYSLFGEVVFA